MYNPLHIRSLTPKFTLTKSGFKCKSRGMETCLHSRGAALNARETGIWINSSVLHDFPTFMYYLSRILAVLRVL